jgi:predicted signal transduction protein with EAL and GGDEF domain
MLEIPHNLLSVSLVLENITVPGDIEAVVPKNLEALQLSFTQGDTTITVSASIGISLYPNEGRDAEMLIKAAHVAMCTAKKKHFNYQYHRGPWLI